MAAHHQRLERDPWFASLEAPLRARILARVRLRSFAQDGRIYRIGDPPDGLHAVVEGDVRLVAYPAPGRQILNMILRPGNWFGEVSVLDGGPRPHDAIAIRPTLVASLSPPDIDALAAEAPGFYRHVGTLSCRHQRASLRFIGALLTASPEDRILALARTAASPGDDGVATLRMTQEDMAGLVGLSRQHLNTLLGQMERGGRITRGYGVIRVLDRGAADSD
ncbi:Crp/Fnr family transcriptional regulator [Sphingomonas cavernae]|nr:Crp/Fnr family transcriptional regulator [Sphingomonas cavernae]